MSDWNVDRSIIKVAGYPGGSTIHTTVTANAAANTIGDWAEIIPSLPHDSILIVDCTTFNSNSEFLFDLGVGAAGSEIVLVNKIAKSGGYTCSSRGILWEIPIIIPAGTRVSIRCQCKVLGSKTLSIAIIAKHYGGYNKGDFFSVCDSYGYNTSDSGGTAVDPGGVANTYGGWTEIKDSTLRNSKALLIGLGNSDNSARNVAAWSLDIAIGAIGSELIIIDSYPAYCSGNLDYVTPTITPLIYVPIPAGSRIAARAVCTDTDAADRLLDIIIYAFS